ncbi:hypothetical protein SAMN05216553_102127 [Lentzea fradiae]|uniref:Gram-positive cocci surface proteins LPxTG domain-containing protein n=1 Tax=Lentzea fradiae TaxID=200378 RepID=A0A1G7M6J6_9PSEU|nr:SdrD B-like domain-containing protein [Lentzea fradiae]SDF57352.1 hypothetical protein SAMN05216553_102127 [Lentzea fradiae]
MGIVHRAAAVGIVTSLVAVPLALPGTAFAQNEDRPSSFMGGTVFNDLNGDGVRQEGEPGIKDAAVLVKGTDGKAYPYSTDAAGNWLVKYVQSDVYEVSYVDSKLGGTTPSSVRVDVTDHSGHSISFGLRGGSICGVAWMDENSDGERQAGEGPVSGRLVYLHGTDRQAHSGADGGYCFDGLGPGEYRLFSSRLQADRLVLTKGGGDSKFDWVSALSQPVVVGKGEQVTGIDSGYVVPRADLKAVQVLINRPGGGATDENDFRVGDVIEVYGSVTPNGDVPESIGGVLTLPEGLRIEAAVGGLGDTAVIRGQEVHAVHGDKKHQGLVEFLGARVVVEKEFTGGEIKWQVQGFLPDTDPSNDVLTRTINALPAQTQPQTQPQGGAPVAAPAKTAGLANTGVDPVAAGAIGLGALALGGLALFGARRRQQG